MLAIIMSAIMVLALMVLAIMVSAIMVLAIIIMSAIMVLAIIMVLATIMVSAADGSSGGLPLPSKDEIHELWLATSRLQPSVKQRRSRSDKVQQA